MVEYNAKLLKKILVFTILFFIISVNIFLYVYSNLNLNPNLVQKFDSKKTLVLDLNDNLNYEKNKLKQIKVINDRLTLKYSSFLDSKISSNSNLKNSNFQGLNLKTKIAQKKKNIAQLKSDINTLNQII